MSRLALLLAFMLSMAGQPASAQTADARKVADLEARILSLEEEIRQLRGRVEEAEYQAREANQRMERLLADVDARLQGVEPSPAPGGPNGGAAAPVAGASAAGAAVATAPSSAEPGVIGTLPRDALLGLPEPPPEPAVPAGSALVSGSARDRFDAGMARVKAGDWAGAEAAFASVVASSPDDPLAPNAAYWQAETYYARKDWPQAAAGFARNVRTYGEDAIRSPDNLLKLGMSLVRLGDTQKACAAFAEFDRRYPGAPAALKQMAGREKASAGCS
ncbi:tol-pal system protein YbgF [Geminicoccus roseus]|uniref:tol-pal system protein YbgF n=1 Tax=Geminicoccus roseus TaxID=404900 RepID=UPI0003FBC1C8|nr:tol-pal system protein YbgF [Geminicoccus roseus]